MKCLILMAAVLLIHIGVASAEDLRDRNGNLLGKITQRSDGKLEGRDRNGNLRGTYDPRRNETRDRNGNLVGHGDMLSNLVIGQ
jgi:hypothetical protein